MTTNLSLAYIEELLKTNEEFFKNRRNFNRRAAFWLKLTPTALAGLVTVLIGAAGIYHLSWLQLVAMAISGIVTVLGAWHQLFANRELWALNNQTLAEIYELQCDISFRKTDASTPISQSEIVSFFEKSKAINQRAETALANAYATK